METNTGKKSENVDCSNAAREIFCKYRIAFMSLGCRTNQYESDVMKNEAQNIGFKIVQPEETADFYVLNTCAVTGEAGRKSRQMLRKFQRQNAAAIVVAVGCAAEISDLSAYAALTFGTHERKLVMPALAELALSLHGDHDNGQLVGDVKNIYKSHKDAASTKDKETKDTSPSATKVAETKNTSPSATKAQGETYQELSGVAVPTGIRAFLKIQDGCNCRCSYCAIRLARGKSRSRTLEHIYAEAIKLTALGYHELVLTGTNLASYGYDFTDKKVRLLDVVEKLAQIEGVSRLRLGSIDCHVLTTEFLQSYKKLKAACPHFHLSLQSGSTDILRAMQRKDTKDGILETFERVRRIMPEAQFSCDLIVGFPGETDADFADTLEIVRCGKFVHCHIFRFSARPDTKAYSLPGQVEPEVIKYRAQNLSKLATTISHDILRQLIGQTRLVMLEEFDAHGNGRGYSEDYIDVVIKDKSLAKFQVGSIVKVKIIAAKDTFAVAELI